jgi:hypothetical protein
MWYSVRCYQCRALQKAYDVFTAKINYPQHNTEHDPDIDEIVQMVCNSLGMSKTIVHCELY